MKNRKFLNLIVELEKYLLEKELTSQDTNLLEDKILDKASINEKMKVSDFGPVDEDNMYVMYVGMSQENAEKLMNYFKSIGIEASMKQKPRFESNERIKQITESLKNRIDQIPEENREELINMLNIKETSFEMDTEEATNKLLPAFKAEIERIEIKCPEALDEYKKKSEKSEIVQMVKLNKLSAKLTKQSKEIEDNCQDPYTKGELHVLFAQLKTILGNEHLSSILGMGMGELVDETNFAYQSFKKMYKESSYLNEGNEVVDEFKNNYKALRNLERSAKKPELPFGGLGMFGGGAPSFMMGGLPGMSRSNSGLNLSDEDMDMDMLSSPKLR